LITDALIRPFLNEVGILKRGYGSMFGMVSGQKASEYRFERNTSPEKIKCILNREPTEEEIERAKSNYFAADNVFCPSCETAMGERIESPFIEDVLNSKLRFQVLTGTDIIEIEEADLTRSMIYLQLWRLSLVHPDFHLHPHTSETIREGILQYMDGGPTPRLPLIVTYQETPDTTIDSLYGNVGIVTGANPYILFTGDMIFQLFDSERYVHPYDFYGLNKGWDMHDLSNIDDSPSFKMRIMSKPDKISFNTEVITSEAGGSVIAHIHSLFFFLCQGYNIPPTHLLHKHYIKYMVSAKRGAYRFVNGNIESNASMFFRKEVPKLNKRRNPYLRRSNKGKRRGRRG